MRPSRPSSLRPAAVLIALLLGLVPLQRSQPGQAPTLSLSRAQAQTTEVAATGVDLTLHDNTVYWKTLSSVRVVARLLSADGTQRAQGAGQSSADGNLQINFGGGGGRPGGGGGANSNVLPGDRLVFVPTGGITATMTVPAIRADVSPSDDRVFGTAPAGAQLEISVVHGSLPYTLTTTADGGGAFALSFAGAPDIAPGDAGEIVHRADGNTTRVEIAALDATGSIGSNQITGNATPGDQVSVKITGADASDKGTRNTSVQGGGTDWAVNGGGGGGGGGGTPFGPIAVGDTVEVTLTSPVTGASRAISAVVPDLSVQVDPDTRTVSGMAPANGTVDIEATSPAGTVYRAAARAGADGSFSVVMADADGIGPGWRVAVVAGTPEGLRFRAFDAIEQIRIGVHAGIVSGVADPGRAFTITVRAGDGTVKAVTRAQAGNNATFNAFTGGGGPGGGFGGIGGGGGDVSFAVGDRVEVEFIVGDPVVIIIPPVSARTDQASDSVSGQAPAGSIVTVTQGGGQNGVSVTTTADAGGNYRASFDGQRDIAAPMGGNVNIRLATGHELYTTWAAVQLTVELGNSFVQGNGPLQRNVVATLVDKNGRTTVGAAEDDVAGGGGGGGGGGGLNGSGFWSFSFTDSLGEPVIILPGDRVDVLVGDDQIQLTMPPLSGVAFVADDLVNGITTPNRAIDMTIQHIIVQGEAAVDLVSDADGKFTHSFAGEFDIQFNDRILFHTMQDGHNINSRLAVPGLRYNLDTALLTGSWRPSTPIEVLFRGLTGDTYSASTITASDASFTIVLEKDGKRPLARPGDTIIVQDPATRELITLTLPELTVAGDVASDDISGRATAGGALQLRVNDAYPRGGAGGGPGGGGGGGGFRLATPEIGADGSWTFNYNQPNYDVQPGSRMWLIYREPGGHIVERMRYVPIVSVQHGGSKVCGFAEPRQSVQASILAAAGSTLGSAAGTIGFDSSYDLVAVDGAGAALRTEAGQKARVQLGGEIIELELPALSIDVTWGQNAIRGTGPANSVVRIRRPADSCLPPNGGGFNFGAQTNDQGAFQNNFGANGINPGEGLEVAFFLPSGHRVYRNVFRSLGQIFVETNRVQGRATPATPVVVTLMSATGATRGSASTTANADGYFVVELKDAGGNPLIIQPTDLVHLDASGETPDIPLEPLRFDWSVGDIVTLEASPNRLVQVTLAVKGRDDVNITITTGADGTWKFTAADIPPRQTWTLDDIEGVRAVVETPNEHQIVAQAGELGDAPIEPPRVTSGKIFLPMTVRGVRVR